MPIDPDVPVLRVPDGIVGVSIPLVEQRIDARWLMAYAAALGETDAAYFDTTRADSVIAHPLFPVCYEWPVWSALTAQALPDVIAPRGVHVDHDVLLHRPPRAGDVLHVQGRIAAVEPRPRGVRVHSRIETVDAAGQPVTTTRCASAFPGVDGGAQAETGNLRDGVVVFAPAEAVPRWRAPCAVSAGLAHIYSECARIWNPIHTDVAVARAAGLPDILLHGTATLALAISELLRRDGTGPTTRVSRIRARFRRPVPMPSALRMEGMPLSDAAWSSGWCAVRAVDAEGATVLDAAVQTMRSREP